MEDLRIVSWNINALMPTLANIKLSKEFKTLARFLDSLGDIVCMQEVKVTKDKISKEVACVEGYESFWATSREKLGYSGCTTWAASPSFSPMDAQSDCLSQVCDEGGLDLDQEGRIVVTDHDSFVCINIYVPNAGDSSSGDLSQRPRVDFKVRFLQAVKHKADSYRTRGRSVIILGDFNMALDKKDRAPNNGLIEECYGERELEVMRSITADYVDTFRHLHPDVSNQFTCWDERTNARASNRGSRIDYILVTRDLVDKVVSCEIIPTSKIPPKWSDHAAVRLTLRGVSRPPPHPPISTSSLKDKRWHGQRTITSMFAPKVTTNVNAKPDQLKEKLMADEAGPSSREGDHQGGPEAADMNALVGGKRFEPDDSEAERPTKILKAESDSFNR